MLVKSESRWCDDGQLVSPRWEWVCECWACRCEGARWEWSTKKCRAVLILLRPCANARRMSATRILLFELCQCCQCCQCCRCGMHDNLINKLRQNRPLTIVLLTTVFARLKHLIVLLFLILLDMILTHELLLVELFLQSLMFRHFTFFLLSVIVLRAVGGPVQFKRRWTQDWWRSTRAREGRVEFRGNSKLCFTFMWWRIPIAKFFWASSTRNAPKDDTCTCNLFAAIWWLRCYGVCFKSPKKNWSGSVFHLILFHILLLYLLHFLHFQRLWLLGHLFLFIAVLEEKNKKVMPDVHYSTRHFHSHEKSERLQRWLDRPNTCHNWITIVLNNIQFQPCLSFVLLFIKREATYAHVQSTNIVCFLWISVTRKCMWGHGDQLNNALIHMVRRVSGHLFQSSIQFFCGLPINDCNAWRAVGMCSYKHSNNVDMSCFWNFTSKIFFLSTLELKWIGKVINLKFHSTIRQWFLPLALRVSTISVLWSIDYHINWYVSCNLIPFSSLICEISAKMNIKHVKLNNLKSMETPSLKLWLF